MYQRIKDYFTSPKNIAGYVDEPVWKGFVHFFVLILFYLLPFVVTTMMISTCPKSITDPITNKLNTLEGLDYKIEDGVLKHNSGKTDLVYIESHISLELMNVPFALVFDAGDKIENFPTLMTNEYNYVFVLGKEEFKIISMMKDDTTNTGDINKLSLTNIDSLNVYSKSYKDLGIDNIVISNVLQDNYAMSLDFSILANRVFVDARNRAMPVLLIGFLIYGIVSFGFTVLVVTLIFKLLYPFIRLNFTKTFKIVLLCSAPYVVFTMLGQFLGLELISLIGNFITIIFTIKAAGAYMINNNLKMMTNSVNIHEEKKGDKEDEL